MPGKQAYHPGQFEMVYWLEFCDQNVLSIAGTIRSGSSIFGEGWQAEREDLSADDYTHPMKNAAPSVPTGPLRCGIRIWFYRPVSFEGPG
jgi:hypothetical protein